MLCRVLSANRTADVSAITDLDENDPYYTAVSQAVALGLLSPINKMLEITKPVTRGEAFAILAEAFQLITDTKPETSVLSKFTDAKSLVRDTVSQRQPWFPAVMCRALRVTEYRLQHLPAEFLTVLYKILPNYINGEPKPTRLDGRRRLFRYISCFKYTILW
jgi:hypothetical protein